MRIANVLPILNTTEVKCSGVVVTMKFEN